MKKIQVLIVLLLYVNTIYSQPYNPLSPPNTYRNKDNPFYWKNKLPHEGYWQQDVHYTIKASVNENTDIIQGEEELVYWNNSPDDLPFVFFHLYQNAFQPGSYYDELQKNNDINPVYGQYELQKLGTEIISITANGSQVKTILDNTILKIELPQPIKSGESITFKIHFKTYYDRGGVRRRMKMFYSYGKNKHYDGVHWYPRISVYDRVFGWTTDQHLGHEFYGDFGTYDVELTFANNFIVEATGFMLNREEMLPDTLREKLDISNFKDKPWESEPSVIIPYDSTQRKTWKFHAENVHDFAFTADPTYRIGETEWNGIKCIALAQEQHASGWQNAADYTAKVIQVYSEDIGMYVYHKMIVADAQDGMEYPMLTLDGGRHPEYNFVIAHEVGHNWFYGQVGNNETYRAALDEGFTQFLTAWSMNKLDIGVRASSYDTQSKYIKKYKKPSIVSDNNIYYPYLKDAIRLNAPSLNVHSDYFNGALGHDGGYRHVYYKTATMLYNLQYVLGDELFLNAMKHYFNQWKIAHPYLNDFRTSIIQFTKVDLNWFFDQWLETDKNIDYAIQSVKKGERKDEYMITLKRKESMQMPIDLEVIAKDGKKYQYYIPNTWFEKKTEAIVLPKWQGWDKIYPTYTAKVIIPEGISNVIIDPSGRLADVCQLDNSKKMPVSFSLDHRIQNNPDFRSYEIFTRPDIWYNGFDGLKTGVHFNGNYMEYLNQFNATVWYNTNALHFTSDTLAIRKDKISFVFDYKTAIDKYCKGMGLNVSAKFLDGLIGYSVGLDKDIPFMEGNMYFYFKSMYRKDSTTLNYLLFPDEWKPSLLNNTINIGLSHHYRFNKGKSEGDFNMHLKTSAVGSDYDYASFSMTAVNYDYYGKIILKTRTFLQFGVGSIWPSESELYFSGANTEEMMNNKYTRSIGFFPQEWADYGYNTNHFHYGGGLNLRGYAGYFGVREDNDGNVYSVYKSHSGAAINMEMEFNKWIKWNPALLHNAIKMVSYLFGDAGVLSINEPGSQIAFSKLRADAGIGAALTIQKWGKLEKIEPLTLRFDVPLWLNRTPDIAPNYLKFRWIVGVKRSF